MIFGKKVTVLFVLALLIICIVGVQSYMAIRQVNEANRIVIQTQSIQENLEHILSMLKDAETAQRGFVLTGKDSYLAPYNAAVDEIPKHIDEVTSLTLNDPEQHKNIELLKKLSRDKLGELEETIRLRRDTGMDSALSVIRQDLGKQIMDNIRMLIDRMVSLETRLLDQQKQIVGDTTRQSLLMVGLGVLLALIVLGVAVLVLTRTMKLAARSPVSVDSGRNWKGIAIRYLFAATIVAVASGLRWWLIRTFGPMPLFVTWYPAVLLTAIVAGGGPGILATILSIIIADYWFIEPIGFGISAINDAIATGIFAGTGIFLSIFAERLKRARLAEAVSLTQKKELALLNMGNLMTLDLDHRILNWSEGNRKLYGFNSQEVSGQLTYEIFRTKFNRPMEEIHKELIEASHWEGEATRTTRSGKQLSVALLWALRRDENGKPISILEVSTDLTQQKLAEESLRQQAEELAQQNEELHAQSEELAQQSEELSEQNEELQTQSEEIQTLNVELIHRERILQKLLDAANFPIGEHEVMGKICQAAIEMTGAAVLGAVVCEARDNELLILAHAGFDGHNVPDSWPVKGSFIEMIMQQDRTGALEDSSMRPDFNLLPVAGLPRFAAVLSSPLHINDKCIGAVSLYSDKPQQWTSEQFRLIEWLAAKCSNALTAMRLAEEVSQSRKQNDFLANIVESSSQAFGVGYSDGSLGLINRAFEELTGYSGEELRSIDWAKTLTPPEWHEIEKRKLEELHRTGLPVRYEKEYVRKDGVRVPIELLVHLIKDEKGNPLYYYSFINDIMKRKQAEAEVRRLAQQRQLALDAAKLGWWQYNPITGISEWDDGYKVIFGMPGYTRPNDEILQQIIHPEDLPALWAKVEAALNPSDPQPYAAEYRINRPDGQMRWVEAYGTATFEGSGQTRRAVNFVGTVADITERKNAEEELRLSEEKFVMAFANNPAAVALTRFEDGVFLDVNNTWVELNGYSRDEVIGISARKLHIWPMPEAAAKFLQELKNKGTLHGWEQEFYKRSGETFVAQLSATVLEMHGEKLILSTFVDITEKKNAEEALRANEERLKLSQEVAHLGSWELDLTSKRLSWSDEVYRIFGLKAQEFGATYEAFLDRVHSEDRQAVNDAYSGSIRDGRDTYEIEHRVIRKDNGEVRTVHEKCEHFRDPATGNIIRSVGMVQDITERKQMEEEIRKSRDELELRVKERTAELSAAVTMLEQANLELQEFTHVTSHDLQEPLRKIQTFCDLIQTRSAGVLDSSGQDYLLRVISSARRMRQLLSDLLQLSRLSGKTEKFRKTDLGKIAHEAVDLFEEELKKSNGIVRIDSMPVIDAEETQMLRLFQNLIGNAVKYRDEKNPLINISSRHDRETCEIFIKDNGIGFEQEYAERIFKPFQRLHDRKEYEGTGMGLAICRKIVERHGGNIRAESEPGKGSTFIITLPARYKTDGEVQ
jgi:PAS domain S-box-containing protein